MELGTYLIICNGMKANPTGRSITYTYYIHCMSGMFAVCSVCAFLVQSEVLYICLRVLCALCHNHTGLGP